MNAETCPSYPGFTAKADVNHYGDDLNQESISTDNAAAACLKDVNCAGFSSDGWFKYQVMPVYSAVGLCLYTKTSTCLPVAGFTLSVYSEYYGGNIGAGNGLDPEEAAAACNNISLCQAFSLVPDQNSFYLKGPGAPIGIAGRGICLYTRSGKCA